MSDASAEARLLRLRADTATELLAAEAQIAAVTAARADANSDDEHDPEGVTIGFERSQADALRGALQRRLADVDAALDRLAAGTYGVCTVCGEPIPAARLEARPTTDRCIRHA
jgi:DnaK suppressor protein